jgi:hypothetical protein
MDTANLSSLGPLFSPITAAVFSSVITFLVTYYIVVKRQYLIFWISRSDDIALPLRQQGMRIQHFFSIKIGDREFDTLNKCTVHVKNKGNVPIRDLSFDVVIPGQHRVIPTIIVNKLNLKRSIQILGNDDASPKDPIFNIVTTYLNPK